MRQTFCDTKTSDIISSFLIGKLRRLELESFYEGNEAQVTGMFPTLHSVISHTSTKLMNKYGYFVTLESKAD